MKIEDNNHFTTEISDDEGIITIDGRQHGDKTMYIRNATFRYATALVVPDMETSIGQGKEHETIIMLTEDGEDDVNVYVINPQAMADILASALDVTFGEEAGAEIRRYIMDNYKP